MYTLKKSLGQHFLKDETIAHKIIDALPTVDNERLLEVGAGGGALTKFLYTMPFAEFKTVELDNEKVAYLIKTYPLLKESIIHADFLDLELPFSEPFMLIGNFPYNISTQIVFRVLEWRQLVTCMVGMFQKEVAQRIAAAPHSKSYGILSVLVQAFYTVEYLFDVAPTSFDPPPKVQSGVIRFLPRVDTPEMRSEKDLFLLVKMGFNQRRKMLRNAVKPLFSNEFLEDKIFSQRAEDLSVADFCALTFKMN